MLPEISDLGQASSVGLGLRDPEGPLLQGDSARASLAIGSGHTRPISDPFSDGPDSARESVEWHNDHNNSQYSHLPERTEAGSHHMGSPPVVITPEEEPNGRTP